MDVYSRHNRLVGMEGLRLQLDNLPCGDDLRTSGDVRGGADRRRDPFPEDMVHNASLDQADDSRPADPLNKRNDKLQLRAVLSAAEPADLRNRKGARRLHL